MAKVINQDKLQNWLNSVSQTCEVWAPQENEGGCQLAVYKSGAKLDLENKPRYSAKETLFPQMECMLKYSYKKDANAPEEVALSIETPANSQKRLLFGVTPCDVAGINFMEKIFNGAGYKDPYFNKRRSESVIVAISCLHSDNTCFCTAVGGSPVEAKGADVLLTKHNDSYVAQALTPAGESLINNEYFNNFDESQLPAIELKKQAAVEGMSTQYKFEPTKEMADKLLKAFKDGTWKEATAGCLSCGVCTFVCPTCHCFTIADEGAEFSGERIRCWDACMFPLYTLEASGHNPRPEKSMRYRNRINHKYCYSIINNNTLGCTGCGRCIKACPSGMDIRKIVTKLMGAENVR